MSRKQYAKSVLVRLTDAEKRDIEARAERAELSVSRFLVKSGLDEARAIDPQERQLRERALFELRKVGVNLNQVAYALNAARRSASGESEVSAAEIREIASELKAVLEFLKATL